MEGSREQSSIVSAYWSTTAPYSHASVEQCYFSMTSLDESVFSSPVLLSFAMEETHRWVMYAHVAAQQICTSLSPRMVRRCPSVLQLPESQEDSMALPWGYQHQGEPLARADVLCAELITLAQQFAQLQVCCHAIRMIWMSLLCSWIVLLGVSPSTFLFGCKELLPCPRDSCVLCPAVGY